MTETPGDYIAFAAIAGHPGSKITLTCADPDTTSIYPQVDVQHGGAPADPVPTSEHRGCPYCAGTPQLLRAGRRVRIACEDCEASSRACVTEVEAWQAWDTRTVGA